MKRGTLNEQSSSLLREVVGRRQLSLLSVLSSEERLQEAEREGLRVFLRPIPTDVGLP
jgi:hypothetical protein